MSTLPSYPSGTAMLVCTEFKDMYEIHEFKFDLPTSFTSHTEVVPLSAAFCVDVVLHVELVDWE